MPIYISIDKDNSPEKLAHMRSRYFKEQETQMADKLMTRCSNTNQRNLNYETPFDTQDWGWGLETL